MNNLAQKGCEPLKDGDDSLSDDLKKDLLAQISDQWSLIEDDSKLFRRFIFDDFKGALELANKIGVLADKQWHHPDLKVCFGKLEVVIWTHKIGNLLESDFILAAKIDELF